MTLTLCARCPASPDHVTHRVYVCVKLHSLLEIEPSMRGCQSRVLTLAHPVDLIEDLLHSRSPLPLLSIALLRRLERSTQLSCKRCTVRQVPSNHMKDCAWIFRVRLVEVADQILEFQYLAFVPRHSFQNCLQVTSALPFFCVALLEGGEKTLNVFDVVSTAVVVLADELK